MEAFTSNVFLSFCQFFIGILFIYYVIVNKLRSWFIYSYILGLLLQSAGVFLFAINSRVPINLLLNFGVSLLFLGYALVTFNVISFDQIFRKKLAIWLGIFTLILIIIIMTLIYQPFYIKAIFLSIGGAFYFLFGGISILLRHNKTAFQIIIGINFLVFTLAWFIWTYTLFAIGEDFFPEIKNYGTDILRISALANILITSVGYLLIIKEQDEIQIKEQHAIIQNDNSRLIELNSKKNRFFQNI